MFSQDASNAIETLCTTELYIKIVEYVDADDPRDPEDDENEQE